MNATPETVKQHPFIEAYFGCFTGIRHWHHLDAFWEKLRHMTQTSWYLYSIGEPPPQTPSNTRQFNESLAAIDALLRKEHQEDYCGIVYVDNIDEPSYIKIYDPKHLGIVCGFSDVPTLPGWILSTMPPCDITEHIKAPVKDRWWQKIF